MSQAVTRIQKKKKVREEVKPPTKEKFLEKAREVILAKTIYPLNDRQEEYFKALQEKDLVVATGFAGTSKTFVACCFAADAYTLGSINKIVLARPAMSLSKGLGYNSGDLNNKMKQWVMPMLSVLYMRMGKVVVDMAIEEGNIVLQPLESIKGMSFGKYTWVIADEIEDCTIEEVKSIITRNGGAKMTLCGDITQSCLNSNSGLFLLKQLIKSEKRLQDTSALIDFDSYDYIVRSKLCKDFIIAFDKAGY